MSMSVFATVSCLSCRSFTSVLPIAPSAAVGLLRKKENHAKSCDENGPSPKKALQKLMAGEVLDFTDTTHVEFKNFSTRDVLKYIREILLNYVSAFANTQGGYLIFGVDDSSKVVGSHSEVEKEALAKTVADVIGLLPVYHFCRFQATVQFKSNILNVYDKEEHLHGYVCALRGKPFCWAVFHDIPHSWIVKAVSCLVFHHPMTRPVLQALGKSFCCFIDQGLEKEVFSLKGNYNLFAMSLVFLIFDFFFLVGSNVIKRKPKTICIELFSEYPGLEDLMRKQILPFNERVLIFSRSWAVDIGLLENQDNVCNVLLVAKRHTQYCVLETAYTSKVCVIPKIMHLNCTNNQMEVPGNGTPSKKNKKTQACIQRIASSLPRTPLPSCVHL
uniref:Schlafen AlbA-2 domain-containing protein n=1 Tax=Apteryx owenii TaxID=8824 RepID=A0A8B9SAP3_APTOW